MTKIYMGECPCRYCKERKVFCHAECEKFKKWKDSAIEKPKEYYIEYGNKRLK